MTDTHKTAEDVAKEIDKRADYHASFVDEDNPECPRRKAMVRCVKDAATIRHLIDENREMREALTLSLADAAIIRRVFLPANPNKMRSAAPEVVDVAKRFIQAVDAALAAKEHPDAN